MLSLCIIIMFSYFDNDCCCFCCIYSYYFCYYCYYYYYYYYGVGTLYTELDDLDEAGAVFTRLLELDPTDHYVNSKRRRIYELKNIRKRQEKNRK